MSSTFPTRLLRAWSFTAVTDFCFAVVLTYIYGRTFSGLWGGVASTVFGAGMSDGSVRANLVGIGVHIAVAFVWSLILVLLYENSAKLRGILSSFGGIVAVAAVYGPLIWFIMSVIVIPFNTHKPAVFTGRWFIQLAGHAVFVGLPMVLGLTRPVADTDTR